MTGDGSVTIVPSVHFSPRHRRRVRQTVNDASPDVVAVELGEDRYERLEGDDRPSSEAVGRTTPAGGRGPSPDVAPAQAVLRAVQRSVVRLFGLDPDETDMEAAIWAAAEVDADVALVDDPLEETVRELARRVGPATATKAVVRSQLLGPADLAEQLEAALVPLTGVDSGDDVQPVVDQMRRIVPELTEVLIDRRDRAMAARLHALRREGLDVVAVVGAAHHNGIERRLADLAARDADPDVVVPRRTPEREVVTVPVE